MDEVLAAGGLEVRLGGLEGEQAPGGRRDVAVAVLLVEEEGARVAPEGAQERRGEERGGHAPAAIVQGARAGRPAANQKAG